MSGIEDVAKLFGLAVIEVHVVIVETLDEGVVFAAIAEAPANHGGISIITVAYKIGDVFRLAGVYQISDYIAEAIGVMFVLVDLPTEGSVLCTESVVFIGEPPRHGERYTKQGGDNQ